MVVSAIDGGVFVVEEKRGSTRGKTT